MMRIHGDFMNKKNEEMLSGNDEKEMHRQSNRQQEANQIFAMHCENFSRIAKISQP